MNSQPSNLRTVACHNCFHTKRKSSYRCKRDSELWLRLAFMPRVLPRTRLPDSRPGDKNRAILALKRNADWPHVENVDSVWRFLAFHVSHRVSEEFAAILYHCAIIEKEREKKTVLAERRKTTSRYETARAELMPARAPAFRHSHRRYRFIRYIFSGHTCTRAASVPSCVRFEMFLEKI